MRIVQSCLFIVALPIAAAATVGNSGTDSREVVEDSNVPQDTINISPRGPFSFNDVIKGVQNVTGAIEAAIESSDFLRTVKESEEKVQGQVHHLLEDAATYLSTTFTDVASAMNHLVSTTATFRDNIKDALDARNITFETLTEELETMFTEIVDNLEKIPPPDKAPGHAERAKMVDKVLDDTKQALIKLARRHDIGEDSVTTYIDGLKPHAQALIVAIGDINEQHPQLFPALAISVAILLIPESWILRPFLSVFGFGPAGPVKGSVAAWWQSHFWGAAVESGSWFSWLQAAGMGAALK